MKETRRNGSSGDSKMYVVSFYSVLFYLSRYFDLMSHTLQFSLYKELIVEINFVHTDQRRPSPPGCDPD